MSRRALLTCSPWSTVASPLRSFCNVSVTTILTPSTRDGFRVETAAALWPFTRGSHSIARNIVPQRHSPVPHLPRRATAPPTTSPPAAAPAARLRHWRPAGHSAAAPGPYRQVPHVVRSSARARQPACQPHFRVPHRKEEPHRHFIVPHRKEEPHRHFRVPHRKEEPHRHFRVPHRKEEPHRHFRGPTQSPAPAAPVASEPSYCR
jgi:hypothetical protein